MAESPFGLHEIEEAGPNGLARKCEALLPTLLANREAAKTKRERKQLSSRIKATRMLLKWARTRAGYVQPLRPVAQAAANKLARKADVPSAEEE